MKAIWNNTVIAESENTVEVEGSVYFPSNAVRHELLQISERQSYCPWKGMAQYYSVVINGETNPDAAWSYAEPRQNARSIQDFVAFWHGVQLTD